MSNVVEFSESETDEVKPKLAISRSVSDAMALRARSHSGATMRASWLT